LYKALPDSANSTWTRIRDLREHFDFTLLTSIGPAIADSSDAEVKPMSFKSICLATVLAVPAVAQPPVTGPRPQQPVYRVTIVQRTTPAINYTHRSEPTKIDFHGTALLPQAYGDAVIENRRGATMIDARFKDVPPPTRFGPQYLTYVVWSISPEGRAQSVGELILNGSDKGHLQASTPMQSFALIVTAEPYFSVSQPSDVVVMENALRPETIGEVQQVNATYELLPRKEYTYSIPPVRQVGVAGPELSMQEYEATLATYQAQNAIQIARAAGADRYAPDRLAHAQLIFDQTRLLPRKEQSEHVVAKMRESAQIAEDARAISAKRAADDLITQQETQANAAKKQAVMQRAAMEAAESQARAEADRAQREAARAAAEEQARQQAEAANAARAAREQVSHSADRMRTPPPDHTRETRTLLRQRLNAAFETIDSPRGLVVMVPDARLQNGPAIETTRQRLAMVVSELKPYSGLRIEVGGHTDGGNPETARRLSIELASRVRDLLVIEGFSPSSITLQGYGSTRPLASNASASGREQNRRVEIVIMGDAIGNMANWDRTYDLKLR
jgi:flagellar motor protein MotB